MAIVVYCDTEFCHTAEPRVTPVCASLDVWQNGKRVLSPDYWTYDDLGARRELVACLEELKAKNAIFVSFAVSAEARFLRAVDFALRGMRCIDLHLEYRMAGNHIAEIQYGKHYIDGKKKFVKPPPKYSEDRQAGDDYSKMEYSLASASYKFLGVVRDTAHKDLMRERIIRGGPYSEEERRHIMAYCREDTAHLRDLHMAMWNWLLEYLGEREEDVSPKALLKEQHKRAEYAWRTALMEDLGYPLDVEAARRLSENIPWILRNLQRDVNKVLKNVIPFEVFSYEKGQYKRNVKLIQDYIEKTYGKAWHFRTETGAVSISEESLSEMTSSRHEYKATLVDQLLRFARFQQSINGFRPTKDKEADKKTLWDAVGSDGRVRPYFGIYRAQSSRSQPSATQYIFLKSAVFRGLVHPKPGRVILASDYGQQEFLVAAILSGDRKMIEAYRSGDVYLYFAKETGAVPKDATKDSHPEMRDRYKSSVLGMSYLMSKYGLARKITQDTGHETSEAEAQAIIDQFDNTFSTYAEWRADLITAYKQAQYRSNGMIIRLGDGWRMGPDNRNHRSVANVPIQGFGAVAMREAVALCQDAGLDVILTLHDCIYPEIEFGSLENVGEKVDLLCECLDKGFENAVRMSFGGALPAHYTPCRQDPQAWGPDLPNGSLTTPKGRKVSLQSRYADKRAKSELAKWSPILWPETVAEELDL